MSSSQQRSELAVVRGPVLVAERRDGGEHTAAMPAIAADNVVPFGRPRRDATPAVPVADVAQSERPAPYAPAREQVRLLAGLFALSLLLHGGLYFVFHRAPEPMGSTTLDAISVDIVIGDNKPVGVDAMPEPSQTAVEQPDATPTETPVAQAEEPPSEPPVVDEQPPVREPPVASAAPPPEPEPQQVAVLPAEPLPVEPPPDEPPPPAPAVVHEPPPPEPPRLQTKPEPKHDSKAPRTPDAKPKAIEPERRTRTANLHPSERGPASQAGSGVGSAQSQASYAGLVRAHLLKFQRPNQTAEGRVVVSFALDAGGRVARVSVARSSGSAVLDQEAQASVRRASPFPPPPAGFRATFDAPMSFRIAR